jgi:hypothetical protein
LWQQEGQVLKNNWHALYRPNDSRKKKIWVKGSQAKLLGEN